jgi:type I restriction enzyme R subunit
MCSFRGAKGDKAHYMLGELFDPQAERLVRNHCRPHWSQAGAVVFITFRTFDSIPSEVVERWDRERRDWLLRRGWNGNGHWSNGVAQLSPAEKATFHKEFNRMRESCLDSCHGRCLLKRPELAAIVAECLHHFDDVRYRLGDFVVMPNHVHLLAAFPAAEGMTRVCDSWLHYSAYRINRAIGEKGRFWQPEPFDHLVRSPKQYDYLRRYIATNPRKAGLQAGEYLYRRLAE